MALRQTAPEFFSNAGDANRDAMRNIVEDGRVPGLLAYRDDEPVGWCSVAPRSEFIRIEKSPTLDLIDGRPAWAVVCFYIKPGQRGQGVAAALLDAAVEWARSQGAELVEGYPRDPAQSARASSGAAFTGVVGMFAQAGFEERGRRGTRPTMRLELS